MPAGIGYGALVAAGGDRVNRDIERKRISVLENQIKGQQQSDMLGIINKNVTDSLSQVKMLLESTDDRGENVKRSIAAITGPILQTLGTAQHNGLPVNPEFYINQISTLLQATPAPTQVIEAKAKTAGAEAGAKAEAEAPYKNPMAVADASSSTGQRYQLPSKAVGMEAPAPAPATQVILPPERLVNKGEEEATSTLGKKIGERADSRINLANETYKQDALLERIAMALKRGAPTGLGSETFVDLMSLASTLGIDVPENIGEAEAIRRIQGELALRARNPESGLGLTGNTSNKDLKFLNSINPGLSQSKLGNQKIIEFNMKLNQMYRAAARYQAAIIDQHGGVVPMDLDSKMMDFLDNYSFFTEPERKDLDSISKMPPDIEKVKPPSELTDDELKKKLGL